MNHFYIITNKSKDPDFTFTRFIRDYIIKCGKKCSIQENALKEGLYTDASVIEPDVDCVLVLGGDGTLLQAAGDLVGRGIPFMGINLGTLGFLSEVNRSDIEEALEKLINEEYEIENRMMLTGKCLRNGKETDSAGALNEIVITRKASLQIMHFTVSVNGQFLHSYHADGIIIATPTGSTGYSLSAGGPVVEPKAKLLLITPVCPHSMQNKSIVLSPEDVVTIEIERSRDGNRQEVEAIFDGNHKVTLCTGDKIEIRKSEKTTGIVKLSKASFLEVLHRKLSDYRGRT